MQIRLVLLGCSLYFVSLATAEPFALPLRTEGRYILDQKGSRVKLQCVNWYGSHLKTFAQNGLSKRTPQEIAKTIAEFRFNCVRLSYSTEAYVKNPPVRPVYISKLENTTHRRFLDVFDEVVFALVAQGLMVIVNNHNTYAGWCCDMTNGDGTWSHGDYTEDVWISTLRGFARRYRDLGLVVGYDLRNEPRGELSDMTYPVWGDVESAPARSPLWPWRVVDYRAAVERAGAAVLEQDPGALIIVELLFAVSICPCIFDAYPLRGLDGHVVWSAHEYEWLDDLNSYVWEMCERGVREYHFGSTYRWLYTLGGHLKTQWWCFAVHFASISISGFASLATLRRSLCNGSQATCWYFSTALAAGVVLSLLAVVVGVNAACASGAIFCGSFEPWRFDTYEGYVRSRDAMYGHIAKKEPMWIGEFGTDSGGEYWNWSMRYMRERDLHFAYWPIDGEHYPQEAIEFGEHVPGLAVDESYGLLDADYASSRHPWKLRQIQSLMVDQGESASPLGGPAEGRRKRAEGAGRAEL